MLDTIILEIPIQVSAIIDPNKFNPNARYLETYRGFGKCTNNPKAEDRKKGIYKPKQDLLPKSDMLEEKDTLTDINPKGLNTYIQLATSYQQQGKYIQAEGIFRKAIEIDPKNYYAYIILLIFFNIYNLYLFIHSATIFLRNSSLERYGYISSYGLATKVPSGIFS